MAGIQEVIIINDMNRILEQYKHGNITNKDTLLKLVEKFEELQKVPK